MRARRGFTLIELLVTMIVLSILAGISLLKFIDFRNTALAAQLSQDFRAVTVAAMNYFADQEQWPAETGAGQVPAGLIPLLPGQLAGSFDRDKYLLDYENFGASGPPEVMIGIAVTTSDPKLMAKFVQYLGNKTPYFVSGGGTLTYIISGPGGFF